MDAPPRVAEHSEAFNETAGASVPAVFLCTRAAACYGFAMSETDLQAPDTRRQKIDLLLEEYRVLYTLVPFRMTSLDRRVPIATAALATFLGSIAAVPPASQAIFLIGLPLAQVWLVRTTVNHARSFEDVLRRIDEIERRVNELAGEELLVFQSRHPSSGRATGGRTGMETVWTVYTTALLMLAACVYLAVLMDHAGQVTGGYAAACTAIGMYLTIVVVRLRRYRYVKEQSQGSPERRWMKSRSQGSPWGLWVRTRRPRTRRGRRRSRASHPSDGPSPST
jgi:hypothetical protein